MSDQPSWMDAAEATAPPPAPGQQAGGVQAVAPGAGAEKEEGSWVRMMLHCVNIGLCAFMAASAVFGVGNIASANLTDFFLGAYLLIFAALLFVYEMLQFGFFQGMNDALHRNFGMFYGPMGRGLYLIFVGFFNFGFNNVKLSFSCGVTCLAWGAFTVGLYILRPNLFIDGKK
ncbi:unnamed protein product [Chrysoparadoxa australica]